MIFQLQLLKAINSVILSRTSLHQRYTESTHVLCVKYTLVHVQLYVNFGLGVLNIWEWRMLLATVSYSMIHEFNEGN